MPINTKKRIIRQISKSNLLLPLSLFVILGLITVAIVINESSLSRSVLKSIKKDITDNNQSIYLQTQDIIENYRRDIRFLYSTPPIKGLTRAANNNGLDPAQNTTYAQWKSRLEVIFSAFLQNNPDYEQLRVISTNKSGEELVRVDRVQGSIEVIETKRLQNKASQNYFSNSKELSDGEIFMSEISLNREYGKIEFPYRPMLRLSMPIFDENRARFGFIIINVNAKSLINPLRNSVNPPLEFVLTDKDGYFLLHPNEDLMYAKDLEEDTRINNYYISESLSGFGLKLFRPTINTDKSYYTFNKKITLTMGENQRFLSSYILAPDTYVSSIKTEQRTKLYTFLAILVVVLTIILSFFSRNIRKSQEMANARAQSEAIINGSSDAVIGITENGLISSWNKSATLMFNLSALEAIGKPLNDLKVFNQLNLDEIIALFKNGARQHKQETNIISNDAVDNRYFSLSFSAIVDQYNIFDGVAIIARDITKEHFVEQEILKANQELESKVAIRTKELKKASEVKSAFISNISHEMRTPLNGIVGTLNLIKKQPLTDKQSNYLEMAEVSVGALSVLINDILDLSKIEAGKLELDFKEFNLIKLIESICGSMAVKAQEKGLEFILDVVDLKCKKIKTDPHRLSQILNNLVNNAIKFTNTGFIKVSAYCEQTNNNTVIMHIKVTDSGVGIASENQSKLFTAFSQEDKSVASKFGGTGLGLSICRQLCGLLGGEINFESEKSIGSTFHLTLELNESQITRTERPPRLNGKSFAVVTNIDEMTDSIKNMITAYSGSCVSSTELQQSIVCDENQKIILPDFLIVEQSHQLLKKLDDVWPTLGKNDKPMKVILLSDRGHPQIKTLHVQPSVLSKPILIFEFLKMVADTRGIEDINNNNLRRESDSSNVKSTEFNGARVLIVDDNDINIEVAAGVLSCLSLEIDTASNGQQAVDKLIASVKNNHNYHCVFMDCQMPILNGYDAAKLIRSGEADAKNTRIPIIAMTANAMMGEKEKCLGAGMSDYITKPISADILVATATKWLSSTFKPEPVVNDANINNANNDLTDKPTIMHEWDKVSALSRLLNNQELLAKVCTLFLQSTPSKLEELKIAINNNDLSTVAKLSHSLKGSSGDVGATSLHQQFSELEIIALKNTGTTATMQDKFALILTSYKQLDLVLKQYLELQVTS